MASAKPAKTSKHNFFKIPLAILAIFFGVLLMSVSVGYHYAKFQVLALDAQMVQKFEAREAKEETLPRGARPIHIFISKILDVSVERSVFENGRWTISTRVASHLLQSARPGEGGNIIIYGHNEADIFGALRRVKGGEKISIMTDDGKEHFYKVTEVHEVLPSQVEFLEATDHEVLTLYTCSGIFDKNRYIVRAEPVPSQQ
jgi:LPXTG-site transpeptidase (sortase) family protein